MKLTEKSVRQLTLPEGVRDRVFLDDDIRGFAVRVREGGQRTYVYQYRIGSRQRRMTLGTVGSVPLALARKNAGKLEAEVRLGQDPSAKREIAKREASNVFGAVAEDFLNARRSALRPATMLEYERHLRVDAKALHRLPVTAATQADIAKLLNKAAGPVQSAAVYPVCYVRLGTAARHDPACR